MADYEAWFIDECNKLILVPGFTVAGPVTNPLGPAGRAPWDAEFAILYPDGMHVRIAEYYRELPKIDQGRGCLETFAYHYGPCTKARDSNGFPKFHKKFVLRIDRDRANGNHMHYQNENHIPEERLTGFDFSTIEPFEFIKSIEEHRKTSKQLHEILKFKVEPAK